MEASQGLGFETIELTLKEMFSEAALSRHQLAGLQRAQVVTVLDHMSDHLIVQLRGYLLSEPVAYRKVTETVDVEFSKWESWWQHTKAVHFPTISKWTRREPRKRVVTKTVVLTAGVYVDAVYPETNIKVEKLGPVKFAVQESHHVRID